MGQMGLLPILCYCVETLSSVFFDRRAFRGTDEKGAPKRPLPQSLNELVRFAQGRARPKPTPRPTLLAKPPVAAAPLPMLAAPLTELD